VTLTRRTGFPSGHAATRTLEWAGGPEAVDFEVQYQPGYEPFGVGLKAHALATNHNHAAHTESVPRAGSLSLGERGPTSA
jgi:hypothetical protein